MRLLEVKDLKTHFIMKDATVNAINGVSFVLEKGGSLSIVGESGSGKSVTVQSIMRLLPPNARIVGGEVRLYDQDLLRHSERQMRKIRGNHISMIFQDPMSSLNPTIKIGHQIMEVLLWHGKASHREAKERAIQMLHDVGISSPEQRFHQYPFEFSGGMRQRAMIAMALISEPDLLIADEPTTSLDVTVQAQILQLIKTMQTQKDMSVILITHNLAVATMMADEIAVMYAGKIVERARTAEFLDHVAHPYALGLFKSTPTLKTKQRLHSIPGQPPDLKRLQARGCPFALRCTKKMKVCEAEDPPVIHLSKTHSVHCWLYA